MFHGEEDLGRDSGCRASRPARGPLAAGGVDPSRRNVGVDFEPLFSCQEDPVRALAGGTRVTGRDPGDRAGPG